MTWRELITAIMSSNADIDTTAVVLIELSEGRIDHLVIKGFQGRGDDLYELVTIPSKEYELCTTDDVEEARQAARSEVEREYEKAANDMAERATIEDFHRHLAKQIGV